MNLNKHLEFFDPKIIEDLNIPVHIIGVGAVGSNIAVMLAKLGLNEITIWDFDTVCDHNITNQAYTFKDIGKSKVDALENILADSNPGINVYKRGKWDAGQFISGIVFLEVDSMQIRKEFAEANEFNAQLLLVIDGRIGLETGEVHLINWQDEETVDGYIEKVNSFDDTQTVARVSACGTTLSVSPSVYLTAASAVSAFINFLHKEKLPTYVGFNAFTYNMKGRNL